MIEQLFGNGVRRHVLAFFLMHIGESFTLPALQGVLSLKGMGKEVESLVEYGILKKHVNIIEDDDPKQKKKQKTKSKTPRPKRSLKKSVKKEEVYFVDQQFPLLPELKSLVLKSIIFWEQHLVKKITALGHVSYLAFTGFFTDDDGVSTDMLIVGRIGKGRLARVMRKFQSEIHRPIRYTALSRKEFEYRMDITDRFLYDVLDAKKIVVIDELLGHKP